VKELSEWKAKTEEQLEELHEMVDVGQAYEAMVEKLTAKNLEVREENQSHRIAEGE